MPERRGFAAMSQDKRRHIAAMGGRAVARETRTWADPEKAREAGRKGLEKRWGKRPPKA